MTLSSLFSALTPPLVQLVWKKMQNSSGSPRYPSFEAAVQAIGSYENPDIIQVVSQKTRRFKTSPPDIIQDRIHLQNLFAFQTVFQDISRPLAILDLGGALGANYFLINRFYPHQIKRWDVLETNRMVEEGNRRFANSVLHFQSFEHFEAQLAKQAYDLIFAQGVLHYTPDPLGFLETILDHARHWVYISRQPLTINQSKVVITHQTSPLLAHGPGSLLHPAPTWLKAQTTFPITLVPQTLFEKKFKAFNKQWGFEEERLYEQLIEKQSVQVCVRGYLLNLS